MKNFLTIIFIAAFLPTFSLAEEEKKIEVVEQNPNKVDGGNFYKIAVIQGLNKTTAKSSTFEIKVGSKIEFGKISIIAHKCWQSPLEQKPESKILLEVLETRNGEPEKRIFYGWMFASSPSISGLEHPIYDIIALSCKK